MHVMGPQQPRHHRAARRRRQGADRPGGRPAGGGGPLEGGPHCALGGRLGGRKRKKQMYVYKREHLAVEIGTHCESSQSAYQLNEKTRLSPVADATLYCAAPASAPPPVRALR